MRKGDTPMTIKKLAKLPYGQAFVEIDDNNNSIYLWSYRTLVVKIENNVQCLLS